MYRHQGLKWQAIESCLKSQPEKLWSLNEMEDSGGEPDVIVQDPINTEYFFYDCSLESPKKRRSICYDQDGLESRKNFKPENNAVDMAINMGIEILTEEQYRNLQQFGNFDNKTSNWLKTPASVRELGGALFADRHYDRVLS